MEAFPRTIEIGATVRPDGRLGANVPPDVAPGEHRVVLVLEKAVAVSAWMRRRSARWNSFTRGA
jgi:hypothetical protein